MENALRPGLGQRANNIRGTTSGSPLSHENGLME